MKKRIFVIFLAIGISGGIAFTIAPNWITFLLFFIVSRIGYTACNVFYDAMLIFFRKHYGHLSLCLTIPVKAAIYFKAFTALVAMSWRRTRKILGFVPEGIETNARYVFFCLKENLESCSKLVECKGLQAEIRCVDDMKCHAGQHDFGYEGNVHVYAVYDIEAYNYSEILGFFSSNPIETVSIGTYNAKERLVITPDEIITTVML